MEKQKQYIDEAEIKRALEIIKKGELFEIRIIKGRKVFSAYFEDPEEAIRELRRMDLSGANVYFTPQRLHEGCSARHQYGKFLEISKEGLPSTSDNEVIGYNYLLIDLDPVRPAGISSTEEELQAAWEIKSEVTEYLISNGFDDYIVACSGNGYHILVKMELPNTAENKEQVKQRLARLDKLFSTEACHVDVTTYNPARVFKVYGTLSQKGRDTEERPHRMARILEVHHAETN